MVNTARHSNHSNPLQKQADRRGFVCISWPWPARRVPRSRGLAGRHRAWSARIAGRFGVAPFVSRVEPMVHRLPVRPGIAALRPTYHLSLARTWAPRLDLALVSNVTIRREAPGTTLYPPTASPAWELARGPAAALREPLPSSEPLWMNLPAAAAAATVAEESRRRTAEAPLADDTRERGNAPTTPTGSPTWLRHGHLETPRAIPAPRPAPVVERVFAEPPRLASPPAQQDAASSPGFAGSAQGSRPDVDITSDAAVIGRITESVMRQMDRRIQAYRERTGALR